MKLTTTKRIGLRNMHFQFDGNNLYEVVTEANKLSFPDVPCCGICGNEDIHLQTRITQEDKHTYTFIKCYNCGGELTFGRKKSDPNTFYLRKNDQGQFDWKQLPPQQNNQ